MSLEEDVEKALNETLAAFRDGAYPWPVPNEHGAKYKDALRDDFKGKYAQYWEKEGEKVKRMGRHSGSLAALFAQGVDRMSSPRDLTEVEVFAGAVIVKNSIACPPVEGRFCQTADFGSLQLALDGVFGRNKVTVNNNQR